MTNETTPTTIDAHIAASPPMVRILLEELRLTIKNAVPEAEETISYQIPTFKLKGHYLVYFSANKAHIGLHPGSLEGADFAAEVVPYQTGKGTLQFPFDTPLPLDLIRKIALFRAQANVARAEAKKKK